MAKQLTQVPGFYRMALGDFEVTALYDGYVDLDNKLLKGASAATHPRLRHPQYRNYFTPERNDLFAGFRSVAG